jgi:hypothetical protein
MASDVIQLIVWTFNAFWLWLGLAVVLRRLGLPQAQLGAAVLGWLMAGASLPWALPLAEHWLRACPEIFHELLTVL